jgi:glycosyltransferase involved in cell wall biosynthesis
LILVHVTTVPQSFGFFRGQISYMKAHGFQVHGVSSPGELLEITAAREHICVHPVELPRRITPWIDLLALKKLYLLCRRLKPTIVHAHTPKGGLIGTIAARMAGVPVVIYGMRGLPFVTASGLKRRVLCWSEYLSCHLAHRIIAVSQSIRHQAIASGFCSPEKIHVLGCGSGNGVAASERFNPDKVPPDLRYRIREQYQIPPDALVLGYVGRIVKDKGIVDLAEAWQILRNSFPHLHLMMVGPIEPQDPVPAEVLHRLEHDPRVHFTGSVMDPIPFYAAMDILTLPTYREGFPNTPLEGAAMQLPIVATCVDGCVEAVVDGVTGILVPPKDSATLAEAVRLLLINPGMRQQFGQAGRERVLCDFVPEKIWQSLLENYYELLQTHTEGVPFKGGID